MSFFFFKQKTAYEMRISDWSSDVCSSDLDFIVVDGAEGGTGAAPVEFADHVGTPLLEALRLVHNTLIGVNLRGRIRLGASGKIITAFDLARAMAMGAEWCNAARGFMFAVDLRSVV